jgi:uncharacterized protein YbaP (TraB family)
MILALSPNMKRLAGYFVICCAMLWPFQPVQAQKAFFFKIQGKSLKEPSYLFGTYHVMGNRYLEVFPEVNAAFSSCKGLVNEVRLSSVNPYNMAALLTMKDNSISAMLDTNAYGLISDALKEFYGVRLQQLDQMKPMLVATMLISAYARQWDTMLGKYEGKPLDKWLEDRADSEKMEVVSLETFDEQYQLLFLDKSEEEQAKELSDMVLKSDSVRIAFETMTRAYYSGNLDSLWKAVATGAESPDGLDMNRLLKKRNSKWLEMLPGLMERKSQFIAVGAAHLAGPDGLVAGLKSKGFQVIQIL